MMDKGRVAAHFSRAAKEYDAYACVQKKMAYRLIAMAKEKGPFYKILEIGCGTGFLTKLLVEAFPKAEVQAIDISPEMLNTAKAKLANYQNVSFSLADGEALVGGSYDLIISNAVFQWFHDYRRAFRGMRKSLQQNGWLLYATFGENTFHELKLAFAKSYKENKINAQYESGPMFRSAKELNEYSQAEGLLGRYESAEHIEYFKSAREFLYSVKKVGANNSAKADKVFTSRRLLLDMLKHYEESQLENGAVPATYHVIYGQSVRL
jgi:malonyl-CoA O-methyltransferase